MLLWASMILPLVWAACAVAGYLYSLQEHVPGNIFLAVLPAFLLEASFFYVLGTERLRSRIERFSPAVTALGLTVAAVAPYALASIAIGIVPMAFSYLDRRSGSRRIVLVCPAAA